MRNILNILSYLLFTSTLAFSSNSNASLSCAALFEEQKTAQDLLTSSSRPEIDDVVKTQEAEVLKNKRATEDILFETYHEAVM